MKDTCLIILAIIFFICAMIFAIYLTGNLKEVVINITYAFISALMGAFVVLLFLDQYYKQKKIKECKNIAKNIKLKLCSNFLLMENPIKDFLKCDVNLVSSMSLKIGRIYSQTGDIFEDIESINKSIDDLLNEIKKQKECSYSQEKRFDYCVCFIRLLNRIDLNLKHIIELENIIPMDNVNIRNGLTKLLFVKQNLERLNSILANNIDVKKIKEYSETNKSNIIAIIEMVNDLDCYNTVEIIMKNLENLLLIFKDLTNEPELIEYSKLIK